MMTERYLRSSGSGDTYLNPAKMENEFTPRKTMIIMVIVVACFAVLWPKIFYPMLVGSAHQGIKPSAIDKTTGCCYVLSETDVDTIKIMSELCGKIIREQMGDAPLSGRQIINICQDEVFRTCGIDVSLVLQEQVRLGHTTKHILDEIRSLNGSLCLKYNFGVQPWRLGVPHLITLKNMSDNVRQERSPLVRSEMIHPAFRERGRAIPQAKPSRPHPKIIDGRPGPIPGMRPTMGGPGHVVPPSKQQGSGSMGIIMPIYTIGIVIFFTYTLMKIICKKHPDTDTIYSKMDLDARYRKEGLTENGSRSSRDVGSCKLVVNAMSALLEEVDHELEAKRKSIEVAQDECLNNGNLSNGNIKKDDKPSVKIMGMETSESCEGGKKWQSANSSVLPPTPQPVTEHVDPPQEIYLDRTLPPQSQILVADSAIETEKTTSDDDSAVVLAGKMTLSVISLENEELEIGDILKVKNNNTEDVIHENQPIIEEEINHIIEKAIESIGSSKLNDFELENMSREESGKGETASVDNIEAKLLLQKNMRELEKETLPDIKKEKLVSTGNEDRPAGEKKEIISDEVITEGKNVPMKEMDYLSNIHTIDDKAPSQENISLTEYEKNAEGSSVLIMESDSNESPCIPMLNSNAKSLSEDSGSTALSGSNQGSVINVSMRSIENDNEEEEEVSEEESDVEYEEEEIEISEEEELENNETNRELSGIPNTNAGSELVNGINLQNGNAEDEESDEEEIIEEIIEEYSDDERNLEVNSN